ncbi:MAG: hypothetical protein IJJ44_08790 [Solobacterium sp.]|nr:hypothetical protein [Solobacterium sp.]
MRKVTIYTRFAASVGALVSLIVAGGKLVGHNYNIVVECLIMLSCLVILFSITVYNLSK